MVELFRRGVEILATADASEKWEDEGGHRREYLDTSKRLDWTLLGHVGGPSVFDTLAPAKELASYQDWPEVQAIRRALLAAVRSAP